ncbi:MAG TPA: histidine phosphatase family protein [Acidimicrobiales bacterium]|nr:histidine phosphatase family protein [Acidimicrobiales bacterium]
MTTARLLLLRHGETTWNAERRWQGWADTPLSDLGHRQALDAVEHLAHAGLTRAVSSDLQRARRTAETIAAGLGLGEVETDPALRERHVGLFEGHTIEEILATWPECFDDDGRLHSVPEGEDAGAILARALPALRAIAARHDGETVLVVSHGGVIRTIERHLGVDPGPSTPNLGGRWLTVADDDVTVGDRHVPIAPGLVSSPQTE